MDKRLTIHISFLWIFLHLAGGIHASWSVVPDTSNNIINGWEYHMKVARNGDPFFVSKVWQEGVIRSRLGPDTKKLMVYDEYQDALVVQVFLNSIPDQVVLNPRFVKGFTIQNTEFINIREYLDISRWEGRNYFAVKYKAELKLLYSYEKQIADENSMSGSTYREIVKTYFLIGDQLSEVKNLRSIISIFPEHKKEIKKFLRDNKVLMKTITDREMIMLAGFCNSLLNK